MGPPGRGAVWGAAVGTQTRAAARAERIPRRVKVRGTRFPPLLGAGRGPGDLDLDLVADDADGVAADLDLGVVRSGTVGQAEAPGVPGAGDHAVLDPAAAERGAHVRADVVDGVVALAGAEDGDQLAAHLDRLALAL